MDPLSTALVVANSLAVIDNIYRGIQALQPADPVSDNLYVRLITQRGRFARWKAGVGIRNIRRDVPMVLEQLPEESRNNLVVILRPMEEYFKKLEILFKKYGVREPGIRKQRLTAKESAKQVLLRLEGHKRLNEILHALESCNQGLTEIAPPPPGFHVSVPLRNVTTSTSHDESRTSQSSRLQMLESSDSLRSLESSIIPSPDPTNVHRNLQRIENVFERSSKEKAFYPMTELLFTSNLSMLRHLHSSSKAPEFDFQRVGDRLSEWGCGLCKGKLSIDQALDRQSLAATYLAKAVAGTLADMAVILLRVCRSIAPTNLHSVLQLQELFAIEEIACLPSPSLNDLEQQEHLTETEQFYWVEQLGELVECLFLILPALESTMRQVWSEQTAISAGNDALSQPASDLEAHTSEITLSDTKSGSTELETGSASRLLKVDLQLIAAMQESLKDSKYAKYFESKDPQFDALEYQKRLEDEARRIKFWTDSTYETKEDASEINTAIMANLARIARFFLANSKTFKCDFLDIDKTNAMINDALSTYPDICTTEKLNPTANDDSMFKILEDARNALRQLADINRDKPSRQLKSQKINLKVPSKEDLTDFEMPELWVTVASARALTSSYLEL